MGNGLGHKAETRGQRGSEGGKAARAVARLSARADLEIEQASQSSCQ
jgi:hypothetical protein